MRIQHARRLFGARERRVSAIGSTACALAIVQNKGGAASNRFFSGNRNSRQRLLAYLASVGSAPAKAVLPSKIASRPHQRHDRSRTTDVLHR